MDTLITNKDSDLLVNYLSEISADKEQSFFILKWKNNIIVKDCDDDGHLIDLSKSVSSPWVQLTAKPFFDQTIFCIYSCEKCCPEILNLSVHQRKDSFKNIVCHHSKIVKELIPDPVQTFNFPTLLSDILKYKADQKDDDIEICQMKEGKGTKSQSLIAVLLNDKVTHLFTAGKQTRPRCSSCKTDSCKCLKFFNKYTKENPTPTLTRAASTESHTDSAPDSDDLDLTSLHYEDRYTVTILQK